MTPELSKILYELDEFPVEVVEFVGWPCLGEFPHELDEFFREVTKLCWGFV